ncbi:MAG: oligosaccharyl transferase, archaeosortase A system-associated [Thermoplasmatota archaeon]
MVDDAQGASGVPRWRIWLLRLYEIPFLAALFVWSLKLRLTGLDQLVGGSHDFLSEDPDAFYHLRATFVSVAHFPQVLRFDPFTYYPNGTDTNQFGSLFDVIGAAIALIVGHGNPTRHDIVYAAAITPPILGALTLIPFYFLAKHLVGRLGAAAATVALALAPGDFLIRALAGNYDHHVAEATGMALAVWGSVVALDAFARAGPALAWKGSGDVAAWLKGLAKPIGLGVLGALGIVAYFLLWPPAILIVGVFAFTAAIVLSVDVLRHRDTTYLAWGLGFPYALAGVLLLPTVTVAQLNFNTFSLMQPVACFLLAALAVGGHFVGRLIVRSKLPRATLPALIVVGGAGAFFGLQIFAPGLYGSLRWGASWVTGIAVPRTTTTIAEAQSSTWDTLYAEHGLLVYIAVIMLAVLALRILVAVFRAASPWRWQEAFLLVWGAFILRAAQTQVRFNYYLALTVAALFGYVVYLLAEWTGLDAGLAQFFTPTEEKATKQKGRRTRLAARAGLSAWQFAAVAASGILLVPVFLTPTSTGVPAWQVVQGNGGQSQNLLDWTSALQWVHGHTPPTDFNLSSLYPRPAPGADYVYPPGTYGVLSWWDYGHQIEVDGERPPVANPFQQNAPFASLYFTEENETLANKMLDDLAASRHAGPVRYIMIDNEMAAGKFGAIGVWANWNRWGREQDRKTYIMPDGSNSPSLYYQGEEYYKTMLARLYYDDGNGLSHYRLVDEIDTFSAIGDVYDSKAGNVRCFNDLIPSSSCPVQLPSSFNSVSSGNRVLDLGDNQHYAYSVRVASNVKTLEYVPGARLEGTAPAGSVVSVNVTLTAQHGSGASGFARGIVWQSSATTGADGRYSIVVPYSTTGQVAVAQGGTASQVIADGPATVRVAGSEQSVDIPDSAVLQGDVVTGPAF